MAKLTFCEIRKRALFVFLLLLIAWGAYALYEYYSNHNNNTYISEHTTYLMDGRYEGFANVKVGGNSYKIHEDLDNPIQAAETMDKLNTVAQTLIAHLNSTFIESEGGIDMIKPEYRETVTKGIKDLKKNFKTANMVENIPERSGGDTSYVIDKGSVFAMCLRDPKNGNQIDPKFNALVFVLVHEMSHLFTKTYGHDSLFWNNFRFVLKEAVNIGLYEPEDYKSNGSPYCGIVITYSPLYDPKLYNYKIS